MVLIIDDCVDVGRAVVLSLKIDGVEAHCVESAREALSHLALKRPRVVVLDDFMPEMNGVELLAILRADPNYATLPVIFHTAGGDPARRATAEKLGISAWLVKGDCQWPEMLAHIRTHLDTANRPRDEAT